MLGEKCKVLRWVIYKKSFLRYIEGFRTETFGCWKDTFRAYKSLKAVGPIVIELIDLGKKLKTENLSDSEKQTLCDHVQQLVLKLDKIYADWFE